MSSLFRRQRKEEPRSAETKSVERHSLRELCGDEEMYYAACRSLYLEPDRQLPDAPIDDMISDAESMLKNGENNKAFWKFRIAFDKAVYETTHNEEERAHYTNIAKESLSKALTAAERLKAEGQSVSGIEEFAKVLSILGKRLDEYIGIATHYYIEGPHR